VDTLRSLSIAHARLPHTFIGHYLAGARSSHACERWCVVDPKSELNAQRVVFSSPTAFTNLVQLNLSQSDVNDNNLLALSGAHNPSLHLAQVWTPGRDRLLFSHRAIGLTKLQDLNLESCCITDTGLAALARMCTHLPYSSQGSATLVCCFMQLTSCWLTLGMPLTKLNLEGNKKLYDFSLSASLPFHFGE
jgi:hypothetical protein